jgi:hypothetical protein
VISEGINTIRDTSPKLNCRASFFDLPIEDFIKSPAFSKEFQEFLSFVKGMQSFYREFEGINKTNFVYLQVSTPFTTTINMPISYFSGVSSSKSYFLDNCQK